MGVLISSIIIPLAICSGMLTACRIAPVPSKPTTMPIQSTATPVSNPVPEFPLVPGQTCVYSSTKYTTLRTEGRISKEDREDYYYIEDEFGLKLITATFKITETVTSTAVQDDYFVAALSSEQAFYSATIDLDELATYGDINNYWGPVNSTETFWYVISGTQLFRQEVLDLTAVEDSFLEYIFPLSDFSSWYPDPRQRQADLINASGLRTIDAVTGFIKTSVPAGDFEECVRVFTVFLSGPVFQYFCTGIGYVSEKHDHNGTRFGFETLLIDFFIKKQP